MKHSKTSLFLMELIISILFFIIAGAVCVQLFVKSHQISTDSVSLNHSIRWCENIAELLQANEGDLSKVAFILEKNEKCHINCEEGASSFTICFNKNWEPIPPVERATLYYLLEVNISDAPATSPQPNTLFVNGVTKTCHLITYDLSHYTTTDASRKVIFEMDSLIYQPLSLSLK